MIESESQIRVRYAETDAMGIVHHRHFLTWFELARIEMMDNVGLPYRDLEKEGALMPVLEVHSKLLKPAYFDDRLTIKLWVNERPRVKLKVEYKVLRGEEILITGETLHAFINREGKPIRPPQSFMKVMEPYF